MRTGVGFRHQTAAFMLPFYVPFVQIRESQSSSLSIVSTKSKKKKIFILIIFFVLVCLCSFIQLYGLLLCRFFIIIILTVAMKIFSEYLCFFKDVVSFLHGFPCDCLFLYITNAKSSFLSAGVCVFCFCFYFVFCFFGTLLN